MIIPCEECLVKPICRKPEAVSVTCNYLYYDIVQNKGRSGTLKKLETMDDIFKLPKKANSMHISSILFLIYPDKNSNSVILYGYANGNKVIDILNPYQPNIEGLMEVDKFRWHKEFPNV